MFSVLTSPVTVEVIEPTMPDRVRRPSDVYALLGYVTAVVVAVSLGNIAVDTTGAFEHDLALVTSGLPRLLLQLVSWAGGIGVLVVPVVIGIDLLLRSRGWQLVHALLAAGLAAAVTQLLKSLVHDGYFDQALAAIASQSDAYATMLAGMSDADLRSEIDLFGQTSSRGSVLVNLLLCSCAAYRTQLFLYLKACGREELSTMNLWGGMDS